MTPEPQTPAESPSLVRPGRQRKLLTVSLMLAMGVSALEGTVVATALPTIVGELNGLTLYPWVFSAYLLSSTTSVPVYGKLADVYGRKPVFLVALSIFLLGTALSGASASMPELIAFRALQGLGAGGVLPLVFTVLGDIYTLRERARVQALFSSVWGVASLVGPAFGAAIIAALSWRWVFLINVPVCLVTMALLWSFLKERRERRQVSVDLAGAITLTLGLVALLLAVLQGGTTYPWGSWQILGLLALAVAFLAAFVWAERRAPDPMVPFVAFRIRAVAVSSAGNLMMGVAMFGLTSYVPLFAQGVRGQSAAGASVVLTPMLLGWALSATLSGRLYVRVGFRRAALLGTGLIALGSAPLVGLGPQSPLLLASVAMGLCGIGLGICSPTFLLAPQSAVPWNLRGVITSSTQFFRTIGGSVGIALLGALLNWRLASDLGAAGLGGQADSLVNAVLSSAGRAALPPETLQQLSLALADGLHLVFLAMFAVALLGLAQVVLFAATPSQAQKEPEPMLERAGQRA